MSVGTRVAEQQSPDGTRSDWLPHETRGRERPLREVVRRAKFDDVGAWREGISDAFVPLAPEPIGDGQFDGALQMIKRGPLSIARIEGSPQRVRRGAREIAITQGNAAYLNIQLSGVGTVRGVGGIRRTGVGAGAIVLAENLFELEFKSRFGQLCVGMPVDWLHDRLQLPLGVAIARNLDMLTGSGRVVKAALSALIEASDAEEAAQCGDLFAATLDHALRPGSASAASPTDAPLIRAIRRLIAQRLGDEDLSPTIAAAALGCSVRTLHGTCQHEGRSFGRMLGDARLDAAEQALRSARPSPGRVGPIAFACGFSDLSHFSRVFKARFGTTPSEYRGRPSR